MQRRVRTIHVRTRRSCTTLEGSCIIDALGADRSERVGARAVRVQRKSPYRRTSRAPRSLGSGGSTAADRADGPGRCACPLTRPASGRVTARARRRAGRPAGQRPGGGGCHRQAVPGAPRARDPFPRSPRPGLPSRGGRRHDDHLRPLSATARPLAPTALAPAAPAKCRRLEHRRRRHQARDDAARDGGRPRCILESVTRLSVLARPRGAVQAFPRGPADDA